MAAAAVTLLMPPPYRSEAWQAWRRHGLGASDLPAVVGCDPYKGEYALALEKRGDGEAVEETVAMRWGARIEALALDEYTEMTGRELVRGETFGDPRWPHLYASLDGRWANRGVEVKATTRWTEPPRNVRVQALAQMGLAGLDAVDVERVSPYGEPLITTIERDEAAIADLLELGEAWYVRYVLGDEMPPVDGSRQAMRYLDRFRGDEEAEATADQAAIVGALRQVRTRQDSLESERRALEGALKASMAGTGVLTGDGFRVTWSAVKPRTSIDHKAVATVYARTVDNLVRKLRVFVPELDLEGVDVATDEGLARVHEALRTIYTTTGEGGTRLLVKHEEED